MSPVTIQLLGDVAISDDAGEHRVLARRQPRTVLAFLVMERHRSVMRSELADLLWEAALPDHWAGAVRGVVSKVRAFIDEAGDAEWLHSTADGLRFVIPPEVTVDVEVHRSTVDAADAALREGLGSSEPSERTDPVAPAGLVDRLDSATRHLGAELAPGATGRWIDDAREDVLRLRRRGLSALVQIAGVDGRGDVAVGAARDLVEADPYSDASARALIGALAATGDRAGALVAFDEFDRRLRDELDVAPAAETQALAASIRGAGRRAATAPTADRGPIVGRGAELDLLTTCWNATSTGGARAVLLLGEAGAGKTRLAAEATRLVDRGRVLWGRCSSDRRVSFEPVIESLAAVVEQEPGALDALGPLSSELAVILPELRGGLGDGGSSAGSDQTAARSSGSEALERSQLFRSVTAAFRLLVDQPSVLVVDDLQWANDDSLALLSHIMGSVADLELLVVFTSRGHGADAASMLEATARAIPLQTVRLPALDSAAVTDLLDHAGVVDAESVGEAVRERTGGNPFFIGELLQSVDDAGRLDPALLPRTLRSWIEQRIAALDQPQRQLVEAAAVLGEQLDLGVLAALTEAPPADVVLRTSELLDAGLLVERTDGQLAFAHALTREAVYDGLGATQRRYLHRLAADALAAGARQGSGDGVSLIAAHLPAAGPGAEEDAIAAMFRAGAAALATTAWVSADDWFNEILARRSDLTVDRVRALIGAGVALRACGRREEARTRLSEALAGARSLAEPRLVAEATLALVGGGARGVSDTMPDVQRASLLRDAIDGLSEADDDLSIPLQLELALALLLTEHIDERDELALDALRRARALGRDDLLANALLGSRVAHHGPEHVEARLAEIDEILALPAGARPFAVTIGALVARHEDSLLQGDRAAASAALIEASKLADDVDHPYWRWVVATWRVLDQIIDGRLDAAEELAFEAATWQADHPEAMACLGVQLVDIRLFQGRSAEVVDLLRGAADDNPQIPCYRAVLALCLAAAGRLDDASVEYRHFADSDFVVPADTNRLLTLAVLADVAAAIEDVDGAAVLLELLAPHQHRQVVLNCFAGGGAYWGPVAGQLARLAALIGDGRAERWRVSAISAADSFGAPLAAARHRQDETSV